MTAPRFTPSSITISRRGVGSAVRQLVRRCGPACVAVTLAVAPCPAALAATAPAADPDSPRARADALSERAVEKFEAHDYAGAVALFEEAHAIDPQPNYLFNIGRVYEEQGDLEHAVEYYKRFVGESGVDLESRQFATERLRVLQDSLETLRKTKASSDTVSDTEAEPDPGEPEPATDPSTDRSPDDGRVRKLRISGYSLLGVGGGALIVGGIVGGLALGSTNDADDAMFVDEQAALRRKARTRAGAADGLFIAGGVLAVVGLVLVLSTLGGKNRKAPATRATARRTRWAPAVSRTGVGLGLTHRF